MSIDSGRLLEQSRISYRPYQNGAWYGNRPDVKNAHILFCPLIPRPLAILDWWRRYLARETEHTPGEQRHRTTNEHQYKRHGTAIAERRKGKGMVIGIQRPHLGGIKGATIGEQQDGLKRGQE